MRSKLLGIALGPVVAGAMVLAAAPASAAPAAPAAVSAPQTAGAVVPIIDPATQQQVATLTINKFVSQAGQLVALGTVTGNGQTAPVRLPVDLAASTGSCQILDLVLGPLNLDVLGLQVFLDTVHLNITAQSGPGNLLGNLLCAVAGLLDNNGPLAGLTGLLNNLLRQL